MAGQNVPLPAGWEAKYDSTQRRYFFIDHSTHKTTWEDPRLAYLQPQQMPAWNQASHQRAGRSPRQSPRQSTENIAMQELQNKPKWQKDIENKFNIHVSTMGHHDEEEHHRDPSETSFSSADPDKVQKLKRMFPTAEEWAIRKALVSSNNVEGLSIAKLESGGYKRQNLHAQMKENTLVNKLKKEFPTAEEGVVRDLIQCVDQNEARCIQELKALGYKHNSLHQPTPSQPTPLHREGGSSPKKSPVKKSSTVEPEVPEATKIKLKEKLGKEFKDYSPSMITIALDSCKYNVDRARRLLENMAEQRTKTKPRGSAERSVSPPSHSKYSGASSSTTITLPDFTLPTTSVTTSTGSKKSSVTVSSVGTKKTPAARHASPNKKTKAHSAGPVRSRQTPVHAIQSSYMSANKTTPHGPDHSLAMGPDKDLLINEYIRQEGPNPDYSNGPDPENEQGPEDYWGVDESIQNGPNPALRCGANHNLLGGTIYGVRPPLVTFL